MPNPIEVILDPVSLAIIGIFHTLLLLETLFPDKALPHVPTWKLRGILAFWLYFFIAAYVPMLVDPILITYQLIDLSHLGFVPGMIVAFVIFELGLYWWHRIMHDVDFLWRSFHQMHHSAERVDMYGASYFNITDMVGFVLQGSICLTLLVGVPAEVIFWFLMVSYFLAVFQHTNIKTPRWLGYIIHRPENHSLHHAAGVHYKNFSDFPIIDILFGTFENPASRPEKYGFYEGASSRISDMLLWKDISKPPSE